MSGTHQSALGVGIVGSAAMVLALLAVGCDETRDRVEIQIAVSGFAPASEIDTLEITITASRTASGDALCEPYTETIHFGAGVVDPQRLPLSIEIKPGPIYNKVLFLRVLGKLSHTVRLKSERMVSLTGGDVLLPVTLPFDCIGVGTGTGQHCVGGLALPSPYGVIFDEGRFVELGEPCLEP